MDNNLDTIALLKYQIDDLSKKQDRIESKVDEQCEFKTTIQLLSVSVQKLEKTVDKLNSKDGNAYNNVKQIFINCVMTAVLSFIFSYIFHK